jgi:hypothetical protein
MLAIQLKCFLLLYYGLSPQHVSALKGHLQVEYINYVLVVKGYNKVIRNISVAIASIFLKKKSVVILTQQDAHHKNKIKLSLLVSC